MGALSPSFINARAFNGPSRLWSLYAPQTAPGTTMNMVGDGVFNTSWPSWYPGLTDFCTESWIYYGGNQTYSTVWTLGVGAATIFTSDLGLGLMNDSPTYGADGIHWQIAGSLQGISNGAYATIFNGGTDPLDNCWVLANTWNHIAMTRSSGTVNLWLNGVLSATTAYGTNMTNPSATGAVINMYGRQQESRYVAEGSEYNFTGYTRNTRYVTGSAVYTAPFTPPPLGAFLPPITGTYFKVEPMADSGDYAFDPGVTGGTNFLNEINAPAFNYVIATNSFSNTGDQSTTGVGLALAPQS